MVEIVDGKLVKDEMTKNARGGTELLADRVLQVVEPELLEKVQIIFSRPQKLLDGYAKVLYLHDLPEDPAIAQFGNPEFLKQIDRIVFVSFHQHMRFMYHFGSVMADKAVVIKNAIVPIPDHTKPSDKLRFIYHTTPHRGLNVLFPVFRQLAKDFPGMLELKVFSSFDIYGWGERDKQYETVIKACQDHKDVVYSKSVPNDVVREELQKAHLFAFPSIWEETSCLALIEAMSANLHCVHSSYGALPETAYGTNVVYPFSPEADVQGNLLYSYLHNSIKTGRLDILMGNNVPMDSKLAVDRNHNLEGFGESWNSILRELKENGS